MRYRENIDAMHRHIQSDHSSLDQKFDCPQCHSKFKRIRTLKQHMKKNHNNHIAEYECDRCGKLIFHKSNLKKHRRQCNGLEKLKMLCTECPICEKIFQDRSSMVRHLREVHLDKDNLACIECNKTFKRKE